MSERSQKLMQGCQHSVVIRVPCENCVEARIENQVRDGRTRGYESAKDEYQDNIRKLQASMVLGEHAKADLDKARRERDGIVSQLKVALSEVARLKAALAEMALNAQAEQAAKRVVRDLDAEEDVA